MLINFAGLGTHHEGFLQRLDILKENATLVESVLYRTITGHVHYKAHNNIIKGLINILKKVKPIYPEALSLTV